VAGTDFQVQIFSWESSLKIFHPSSRYSEIPSSPHENYISILFFSELGFNCTSLDLEGLISGKLNR